jgi:hypothetical protein
MEHTPDEVTVATDALRADAGAWSGAAAELRVAAVAAGRLALPAPAFSFAGDAVAGSYEALRSKAAALLVAGTDNLTDVAAALRSTADQYDADEAANAHALRNIY